MESSVVSTRLWASTATKLPHRFSDQLLPMYLRLLKEFLPHPDVLQMFLRTPVTRDANHERIQLHTYQQHTQRKELMRSPHQQQQHASTSPLASRFNFDVRPSSSRQEHQPYKIICNAIQKAAYLAACTSKAIGASILIDASWRNTRGATRTRLPFSIGR